MEKITSTYSQEEQAWVSPEISMHRDIYLVIQLVKAGKLVIRQNCGDDKWVRVPIARHKDTDNFCLRLRVSSPNLKIKIFTSTQPKEIKYGYI